LQITKALRLELSGTGIRVSTVDPGLAETEFSIVRFKGDADKAKKVSAQRVHRRDGDQMHGPGGDS
jgi:NADP-dependent 3-hydroxy acid dehydrogenase YdfG